MNFAFWCILADGRQNSLDTINLFEAPRRARALGAVKLFVKNPSTGKVAQLPL